ncbi:MAG TPA: hypothetical protein VEI74_04735 [Candidatus Methylomirabilis sp.]|nr:hypothetical protein [Candidatus Methylomirabilis sp.]
MLVKSRARVALSAIALLAAVLGACSTVQVGRNFELSAFESKVQRGVTTQSQVRA